MKYKITISKFLEETIEANSAVEAWNLAWEQWLQKDETEDYYYEIKELEQEN